VRPPTGGNPVPVRADRQAVAPADSARPGKDLPAGRHVPALDGPLPAGPDEALPVRDERRAAHAAPHGAPPAGAYDPAGEPVPDRHPAPGVGGQPSTVVAGRDDTAVSTYQ